MTYIGLLGRRKRLMPRGIWLYPENKKSRPPEGGTA